MVMLAKLIMSLACNNPAAVTNVHKSLDFVHRFYPGNIKDVIHYLMKSPGPLKVRTSIYSGRLDLLTLLSRISKVCLMPSEANWFWRWMRHMRMYINDSCAS